MQVKWSHVLIIVALIFGLFIGRKTKTADTIRLVETVTDTITQEIRIDSLIYVKTFIKIPSKIDTQAVIKSYYSQRLIDSTIVINDVKIKFTGTLYENNFRDVNFTIQNLRPTQIVKEMKWSIFAGASVGREIFAPTVAVQYDKHNIGVGYNLLGDNQIILSYQYILWGK